MKDYYKKANFYYTAVPLVVMAFVIFVAAISLPAASRKWKNKQDDYGKAKSLIEEGFDLLDDHELIDYIVKHGDIDYPFKLGKRILTKMPRFFRFVGPFLKGTLLGN